VSAAEFVVGNVGSRFTPRVSFGFLQPLIRRDFLEANGLRYNERNRFGEDFLFELACLMQGARWRVTPEAMYRYFVRRDSATETQSADDLRRIGEQEERLLRHDPRVASDPALARALRRHKAVIDHFRDYRDFVDAVRARKSAAAMRLLLDGPRSFRHIAIESLLQAPRITAKALHGGYRSA